MSLNNRQIMLGLLCLFGGAASFGALFAAVASPTTCSPAAIQTQIIAKARPGMGPLEREFWQRAIAAAAQKHGLDPAVLTAKVTVESGLNGRALGALGEKGAAQIMPMHIKGFDPFEIETNLDKGAEILASELKAAKGDIVLALRRYNGGPNAMAKPMTENYAAKIVTRVYVAKETACRGKT